MSKTFRRAISLLLIQRLILGPAQASISSPIERHPLSLQSLFDEQALAPRFLLTAVAAITTLFSGHARATEIQKVPHQHSSVPTSGEAIGRVNQLGQNPAHVKFISDHLSFVDRDTKKPLTPPQLSTLIQKGVFVFDIDKTLAGRDQALIRQMVTEIQRLLDTGHLVIINTGQDMSLQRHRIIGTGRVEETPSTAEDVLKVVPNSLRNRLMVVTNDGSVIHHFDQEGAEYIVDNNFTKQWRYSQDVFDQAKTAIDDLILERHGFSYADQDGVVNRENTQIAFKLDASPERRARLGKEVEELLRQKFKDDGMEFRSEISGTSTISLMRVAKKPEPDANAAPEERYRLGLFDREDIGERRSSKPEAFRFLHYELLREGVEPDYRQFVYFGDEWDRRAGPRLSHGEASEEILGNDRLLYQAKDLLDVHLMNVGDGCPPGFLTDRENITMVGGGPLETLQVLRLFQDDRVNNPQNIHSFNDLIQAVARRSTDWERVAETLEKEDQAYLHRTVVKIFGAAAPLRRNGELPNREALQRFRGLLEAHRLGPRAIQILYRHATGGSLIDDLNTFGMQLEKFVKKESLIVEASRLSSLTFSFTDLLENLLGSCAEMNDWRNWVSKIMNVEATWRVRAEPAVLVPARGPVVLKQMQTRLADFFDPGGESQFKIRLFGGRLARLAQRQEGLPTSLAKRILDRVVSASRGLGGGGTLNGGGGSRMTARLVKKTGFHKFMPSGYRAAQMDTASEPYGKVLPLIVGLPAEDDGGGSGVLSFLIKKHFGINVPAMGDYLNTLSGLSLGETDAVGDPSFPYIFNLLRARFPDDAKNVFDQFLYIAHEQVELALESRVSSGDLERLMTLLYEMYDDFLWMKQRLPQHSDLSRAFYEDLNTIGLAGNSVGNLWYVARAFRRDVLPLERGRPIASAKLAELHRSMPATLGLPDITGLPSNMDPGTLYAVMSKARITVRDGEMPKREIDLDANGKILSAGDHALVCRDWSVNFQGLDQSVSEENGHMQITIPWGDLEGRTLTLSEKGKEFAFGGETRFRTRIYVKGGQVVYDYNRGAEEWKTNNELAPNASIVVGMGNHEYIQGEVFQRKWGGRVLSTEQGLVIHVNRLGHDTVFELAAGASKRTMNVRNRVVVRQTQITETEHYFPAHRVGFVDGHVPRVTEELLEGLRRVEGFQLVGPGSIVTSLLPILLIREIRDVLRAKAESGTPIIYIANPYNDNETHGLTLKGVVQLIERSAGEAIFGDGGFIQHINANDWELTRQDPKTQDLEAMAHFDSYPPYRRLRPAERPRGPLNYAEEKSDLKARGIKIYGANLMTRIDKEIRGLGTVDGIGFDPRQAAKMVERIVFETHQERIKGDKKFKTVARAFGSDIPVINAVAEGLVAALDIPYSDALMTLADRIDSAKPLTETSWGNHPPDVMVMNAAHSLITGPHGNAQILSDEVYSALVDFLREGGVLIVPTGIPNSILQQTFFTGTWAIPVEFRDQIFFISINGEQIFQGERDANLWGDEINGLLAGPDIVSQETLDAISREVAQLFRLPSDAVTLSHRGTRNLLFKLASPLASEATIADMNQGLMNEGHFVAMTERIRQLLPPSRSGSLNPTDYLIHPNVFGDTDIRPSIAGFLTAVLSPHGFRANPHAGNKSIDIEWMVSQEDGTEPLSLSAVAFRKLLELPAFAQKIHKPNPMFFFAGRGHTGLVSLVQQAVLLLLPQTDPETAASLASHPPHVEIRPQVDSDQTPTYTWAPPDVARAFGMAAAARRVHASALRGAA